MKARQPAHGPAWQRARHDFLSWTSGRLAAITTSATRPDRATHGAGVRARTTTPLRPGEERTTPKLPIEIRDAHGMHDYDATGYQSISPNALVWLYTPCPACSGSGFNASQQPYCRKCGKSWTLDRLAQGVRLDWRGRWKYLPCTCNVKYLAYRDPFCNVCGGTGGSGFFASMRNIADVVLHLLASRDAGSPARAQRR